MPRSASNWREPQPAWSLFGPYTSKVGRATSNTSEMETELRISTVVPLAVTVMSQLVGCGRIRYSIYGLLGLSTRLQSNDSWRHLEPLPQENDFRLLDAQRKNRIGHGGFGQRGVRGFRNYGKYLVVAVVLHGVHAKMNVRAPSGS